MALDLPPATAVVVVVEADAPAAPRPLSILSDRQARALRAFTEASGLALVAQPADALPRPLPADPDRDARIARVEAVLHAAREPIELGTEGTLDGVRAEVAAAYAEIRAHPEDPEAPFLLGEALRTLARIEAREGDPDAADALRRRAAIVDGDRRIGLSEGGPSTNAPHAPLASVPVRISLQAPHGARVVLDGVPRDALTLDLAPGEHHVRIVDADGATLLARWIAIARTPEQTVMLPVHVEPTACSAADLSQALATTATDPGATFQVACARWVRVVRRGEALDARVCDRNRCGMPTTLSPMDASTSKPTPRAATSPWRSGWTWAALGVTAAAAGVLTAWGLGAFDRDPPPPPTWRWEGAR